MDQQRNKYAANPVTCSRVVSLSNRKHVEDRKEHNEPKRSMPSVTALETDGDATTSNGMKMIYSMLILGALFLFFMGIYPIMRSSFHAFSAEQGTIVFDTENNSPNVNSPHLPTSDLAKQSTLKPSSFKLTSSKLTTSRQTTTKPTTSKLTASKPTTSKPTTSKPTTSKPTTSKPTISKPTTSKPTTSKPATSKPATSNPTTSKPTTSKPTTSKPTTSKPTTSKPTISKPTTSKPTTSKPTTSKPTTSKPTTSKPTISKPTTSKPTTSKPATSKPATSNPTIYNPPLVKPTTSEPPESQQSPPNPAVIQPHNELQTRPTAPLHPQCVFLRMDMNELPAQYKLEYESVKDFTTTPRGAMVLYSSTPSNPDVCVNNPLMQRLSARESNTPMKCLRDPSLIRGSDKGPKQVKTVRLPECAPTETKTGTVAQLKRDPLWVISMPTEEITLAEINFKKAGFNPELTSAVNGREMMKDCQGGVLSGGVLGCRLSYRKLILRALHEGHERVIIVEEDVVLEDDFSENLDRNLRTQRCGGFMFDDSTGGILLLGSSEYGTGGLIKGGQKGNHDKCYNVNPLTYGSFATIYHRNVFLPILAWLDAPEFESYPLDHMWKHLALRGFNVRVLKPMPALADVIHSSSTTTHKRSAVDKLDIAVLLWRSCMMHWDLKKFEFYRKHLESRLLFDFTRLKYCKRTSKTEFNYRKIHDGLVLIHTTPDFTSLTSLANILVARWQAKLDGRYEGYIARPFIVIEAPPGMPPMEMNEILSVVLGMRTQSFDAHQSRVENALRLASASSFSSSSSSAAVATVVQKLITQAFSPVLVLDNYQLEELKRTIFKQRISQMYIELRTKTPWVPTDTQMIELLKTTKPRGRHWYTLDIDPSKVDTSSDGGKISNSALPVPELVLSWLDVQQAASDWLEVIHKYSETVAITAQEILGLPQGTGENEKKKTRKWVEVVTEHVATAESLNNKVQAKANSLDESSKFGDEIESHSNHVFHFRQKLGGLKTNLHGRGVFWRRRRLEMKRKTIFDEY